MIMIESKSGTSIDLHSANIIYRDDNVVKLLLKTDGLKESDIDLLSTEDGLTITVGDAHIQTKTHIISEGLSMSALAENQLMISFEL